MNWWLVSTYTQSTRAAITRSMTVRAAASARAVSSARTIGRNRWARPGRQPECSACRLPASCGLYRRSRLPARPRETSSRYPRPHWPFRAQRIATHQVSVKTPTTRSSSWTTGSPAKPWPTWSAMASRTDMSGLAHTTRRAHQLSCVHFRISFSAVGVFPSSVRHHPPPRPDNPGLSLSFGFGAVGTVRAVRPGDLRTFRTVRRSPPGVIVTV